MAWIIHKATNKVLSRSGDPTTLANFGLSEADVYIFGRAQADAIAQMEALSGTPSIYWNIAADLSDVTEMTDQEKAVVDAAVAATVDAAKADQQIAVEADLAAVLSKVPTLPDISSGASDADRLRALELRVFGG